MQQDSAVAWLFLHRLASRVHEIVERLDQASTQSVLARLAAFLVRRAAAADARPFALGMTQAALAEDLGTVREVVVRSLAHLRDIGVIGAMGRGLFVLKDPARLRALAIH